VVGLQQNLAGQFMMVGWCTPLNKFGGSSL
jgi:hypothetical protein